MMMLVMNAEHEEVRSDVQLWLIDNVEMTSFYPTM